MSIKKFSTYIGGIIPKANHKKQKTLDAEEIIAEIREMILKEIDNMSPNQEVGGRIKVQMAIVPVDRSKWSGAPEEKNACSAFGLTTKDSLITVDFETSTKADILYGHCNVPIIAQSPFILMMQSWVSLCFGSEFSYQVSLSDEQYLQLADEFQKSYGFIPEQGAVSPRGGAIVRELVYPKFNVLIYITCLTELGPRKDLKLAWKAMRRMTKEVRRTLSKYRPETISTYPDVKSALSAE